MHSSYLRVSTGVQISFAMPVLVQETALSHSRQRELSNCEIWQRQCLAIAKVDLFSIE